MPRQIQSRYSSLGKKTKVAPIDKGGTGASTGDQAVINLGGINRNTIGVNGGLVQADAVGHLPVAILKGAGITVGYALEGPSALVYGQTAIFLLTNYNSLSDIEVSVSVGSVVRINEEIRVTAPLTGDTLTLTVSEREVVLPLVAFAPVKPTMVSPKAAEVVEVNVTAYAAPFKTVTEMYSPWTEVEVEDGITVSIPKTAVAIECEGNQGLAGVAYVDMGSKVYRFGKSHIRRRLDIGIEKNATLVINDTATMKYRFVYPVGTHVATDWQLASDANFVYIVQQSMYDTVNLTSWPLVLHPGQYYLRTRYHGTET